MNLRIKLFLAFAAVVLVSILSFALLMRQETARQVRMYMFRGGMQSETSLVESLEAYFERYRSWENIGSFLGPNSHGQGQMGGMRFGSSSTGGGPAFGQQMVLADASGTIVYNTSAAAGSADDTLSLLQRWQAVRLENQGNTVGYLLAENNAGSEAVLVDRLNRAAQTTALIGGSLALVLGIFLAYRLIRPIQELTNAARRLSAGDLSSRVETSGSDEIASLGAAFNEMAGSLQKAEVNRQTMTADIAHELRTPLSVQRAQLEALEDGIYPLDVKNLQPILEQNRLLNRLVEDLRMLAIADAGQLQLDLAPTDLIRLTGRVVDSFLPQARSQGVAMAYQHPEQLPDLLLDPARIEQILSNLLSNALRHSPQGGTIHITIYRSASQVQIDVRDEGPGIPADALEQVFERFYRADSSRARADGGSGLGLAIARQLAEAHAGQLSAGNHPAGGAVFQLILPLDRIEKR